MKPQIINIINFIRGVEPRDPEKDLLEPVIKQIETLKLYHLPGTFLLQYDALIRKDMISHLKREDFEIGIWLEIVQPLAEKAGVKWKGRPGFSWDWHVNSGFTIGYTPEEREKMIDVFMCDFKKAFGFYPEAAGAWFIDAHTLQYLSSKYEIKAFCNCRDQWGTDGYTLWGGYYGQGYYPSRYNAFIPAQNKESQINIPVFRMLGSDPIYQYNTGLDENFNPCDWQDVKTLEPASENAGGSPDWVRWFIRENFNGLCLSFGYAQAGQENSFGWEAMKSGIEDQFKLISEYRSAGKLQVMTLGNTGKWYQSEYCVTPASSITALSDWSESGNRSVWYCSRYYRINIFWGNGSLYIRDIHIFDENCRETYLEATCESQSCVYETLPVIDGNRWSGNNIQAGIYPEVMQQDSSTALMGGEAKVTELDNEKLSVVWPLKTGGSMQIICGVKTLTFEIKNADQNLQWSLAFKTGIHNGLPKIMSNGNSMTFLHNDFSYHVGIEEGTFRRNKEYFLNIAPQNNRIILNFEQ
ncbi:MAG: hypothetical protein VB118_00680 [Oscillospiraceae bacterium]|nr:hypothetical protein [Oscillospiraceae bacterium]